MGVRHNAMKSHSSIVKIDK